MYLAFSDEMIRLFVIFNPLITSVDCATVFRTYTIKNKKEKYDSRYSA